MYVKNYYKVSNIPQFYFRDSNGDIVKDEKGIPVVYKHLFIEKDKLIENNIALTKEGIAVYAYNHINENHVWVKIPLPELMWGLVNNFEVKYFENKQESSSFIQDLTEDEIELIRQYRKEKERQRNNFERFSIKYPFLAMPKSDIQYDIPIEGRLLDPEEQEKGSIEFYY